MPIIKITDEEYTTISKLRERFQKKDLKLDSRVFTDGFLTRILWVSDMDLDKAEKLAINIAQWRDSNGMSEILSAQFSQLIVDEIKFESCGGGNSDGSPVHFLAPGQMDLKKVIDSESGAKIEFIRWMARMTEAMEEDCRQAELVHPGHVITTSLICDYEGFSYRQLASIPVIDSCLQVTKNFDAYYPLLIGNGALIKVPKVGVVFFNIVMKFVGSKALENLKLYNSQEKSWKPAIFSKISEKCIPTYLGGNYELQNFKMNSVS